MKLSRRAELSNGTKCTPCQPSLGVDGLESSSFISGILHFDRAEAEEMENCERCLNPPAERARCPRFSGRPRLQRSLELRFCNVWPNVQFIVEGRLCK
jgi:hypothetical protein